MDILAMHRTLTDAGFSPAQAEAVVKVLQGGVVTKHDLDSAVTSLEGRLDLAVARLEGRLDRLDNKINLILVVMVLAVLAPAADRLVIG
jgi:hypothetical protein